MASSRLDRKRPQDRRRRAVAPAPRHRRWSQLRPAAAVLTLGAMASALMSVLAFARELDRAQPRLTANEVRLVDQGRATRDDYRVIGLPKAGCAGPAGPPPRHGDGPGHGDGSELGRLFGYRASVHGARGRCVSVCWQILPSAKAKVPHELMRPHCRAVAEPSADHQDVDALLWVPLPDDADWRVLVALFVEDSRLDCQRFDPPALATPTAARWMAVPVDGGVSIISATPADIGASGR